MSSQKSATTYVALWSSSYEFCLSLHVDFVDAEKKLFLICHVSAWVEATPYLRPLFLRQQGSTVKHRRYDGNNGSNTPHIDDMSPATQLLVKGSTQT